MKYFYYIIAIIVIVGGVWVSLDQKANKLDSDPGIPPAMTSLDGPQTPPSNKKSEILPKTLEKNKIITTKNGMKIEIIKEGTGVAIKNGQTATVDYVGKLTDGKIFDASKNHGTTGFSFSLGAGQVIKGWEEGVLGMKVGETRILTIPSDMAYGPNGIPGVIPGGATLIFEVTLLAIK